MSTGVRRKGNKAELMVKPHTKSYAFFLFLVLMLLEIAQSQSKSTDPTEVIALNSIMKQWTWQWNFSGDACHTLSILTECDCSYNNGTTCHITQISMSEKQIQGTLSEDIGAFTYLEYLDLSVNYFSGPLPISIGKLTKLRYLYVYNNAFSGTIPKELGNLTSLQSIRVEDNAFSGTIPKELGNLTSLQEMCLCPNNFSGTLPPELGNLVNLETMAIPSCGDVGGQIPSTFANLFNLKEVSMFDNMFTGTLPAFIGNWSNITELRITGNSLEGPIPSSYANLVSLRTLQISDLSNVSSSLDFISLNMQFLTTLIVRNAMLLGPLPAVIGELKFLTFLDLSFNNLSGEIPYYFGSTSLKYVLLGSNNLSGSLPNGSYSDGIQYVDLSYNQLLGDLPEGILTLLSNHQANIVGNNFVFTEQNRSYSQGQYCLQRTFSCGTDTPLQNGLSIDCGGRGAEANDSTIKIEADDSDFEAALCHVSASGSWAVSNVGINAKSPNLKYLQTTNESISNTTSPELFRTARSSAGSLRYYGLNLLNGSYTISLMFAEISIQKSSKSYKSLISRVFDIYVQGVLQFKDFNIAKEAGGVNVAIEKKLVINVTNNYLEIHLFWAGKGTSDYGEFGGIYGPSIAGISALLISDRSNRTLRPKPSTRFVAGIYAAIVVAILAFVTVIMYIKIKKSHADEDKDFIGIGPTFTYSELRNATEDFSEANKLGQGGFGPVYKGLLPDERPIAVKQLSVSSHQGKSEFLAEIGIISTVRHQNLVRLYGCCIEKNRQLLVYEYLERKSLDQALFAGNDLHLDWPSRFKIILGTAKGLTYLHEELTPRIIHRDIKASNILLDAEFCPKISDFGLAKFFDAKDTHISTRIAGTTGYLAPEYAMFGHLTEKADIFGFGVVILEILSGRPNTLTGSLGSKKQYLLEWAWNLYDDDRCLELMDPRLGEFDREDAIRLMTVALWCTQSSPAVRPPMSRVVAMLLGDLEVNRVTSKPNYLTDMMFNEQTSSSYNEAGASTSLLIEGR